MRKEKTVAISHKDGPFERIFLTGWQPYLWILFVGLLIYAHTAFFGLTYLDDSVLLLNNQGFLNKLSNIFHSFNQDVFYVRHEYAAAYRPMLIISFILDTRLGGGSTFLYHFTNIIMHAIAACLVFLLFIKLRYKKELAFFLSLIFATHPMLTQAVAWIPGRNDLLLALFAIPAFICFLYFLKAGKWRYYILHMLFFALALFTKESALALIFLCVVYYNIVTKKTPSPSDKAILAAGWFFITLVWFLLRQEALSYNPVVLKVSEMASHLFWGAPAILLYIGKSALPFNLSVIPTMEDATLIYGAIVAVAITVALVFSKHKRYNFIVFGSLWCVLFLVPSFVRARPLSTPSFFEHRAYLAILGFFIVLSEVDAIKNLSFKKGGTAFSAFVILAVFSAVTIKYSYNFQDRSTFWKGAVNKSPHSPLAQAGLGSLYVSEGMLDEAEYRYKKALEINPNENYIHNDLGYLYMTKGLPKKAEAEYRMELKISPDFAGPYVDLGYLCYKDGRLKEAEDLWKRALVLNPNDISASKNLAIYYYEKKDFKKALRYVLELKKRGVDMPQEFLKTVGGN